MTYCGYENYETWNVQLWLLNSQELYDLVISYMNLADLQEYEYDANDEYTSMIKYIGLYDECTPDGVYYNDPKINASEVIKAIYD